MTDPGSPILAALYQRKQDEAERLAEGQALTIWEAAALGREARVAELLRGHPGLANAWAADGFMPVGLAAVAGGNVAIVQALLDRAADPNARQQVGYTPLMGAAGAGRDEMVSLLLAGGADPALVSEDGKTAASLALEHGHAAIAERLAATVESRG